VYVAHNVFISIAVETGLIGAAIAGLVGLVFAAMVWSLQDRERALWAVLLLVWLCAAATLTWEHRKPTWLFPAVMVSMWSRSFRGGEARPA
jgi:O-antigen ligase